MLRLFTRFVFSLLLLSPIAAIAGNHGVIMPPATPGTYPVACSNLAHDVAAMNLIGGQAADFWEGNPQNGQLRYLTQILAEPQTAIQFNLNVPDDRGLYTHFATSSLPFVTLVCYPTSNANQRAGYALPDSQIIPHMERVGDLPIFPDAAAHYPAIVYSHGLGGSPISGNFLGTVLNVASHGYIVMAVFHGDARITQIHIGDLGNLTYLVLNFDRYVELQALRPLGLRAALDDVLARPGYGDHIDTNKIGGFGGSLGGEAMLLAMGAELTSNLSLGSRPVAQDPRIKAAVGYVPYSGQHLLPAFGNDQKGTEKITRPFLAIGGTADTTAPLALTEQAVNRMRGSRYVVALSGVPHQYLPEYADDVFGWALTFFDAYIKEDKNALARLVKTKSIAGGLDDNLHVDYTAPTPVGANETSITEHYYAPLGYYFLAANDAERAFAEAGANYGWSATGQAFKALATPSSVGAQPVCRYFGVPPNQPTFFYSATRAECDFLRAYNAGWRDLGTAFYAALPDSSNNCPDGTIGVYRLYNNGWQPPRFEPNHRYTTSNSTLAEMLRAGWSNDGMGFCVPQ